MPPFQIRRVDAWELRRRFNEGRYWERLADGELHAKYRRNNHPAPAQAEQPYCTRSQEVSYLDADGNEVARVHQYLRPDGTLGGSGRPDPKRLLEEKTL